MSELSPNAALARHVEQRLAAAGFQVAVEPSDGALVLSGLVETQESREAVEDIVADVAPGARIDNQLEVEAIENQFEPDFTDRPGLSDPIGAAGAGDSNEDDPAESGDVYTPPIDPVLTTDAHGAAKVLGGFELESDDEVPVEPSAMDRAPGDEALADAIRRELAEDAATTDLDIFVAVRHGVAHLRGRVSDLDDADNAESVAARVPGVREVVEELEVSGF
jgi:osmotically-inducible protein OsmY